MKKKSKVFDALILTISSSLMAALLFFSAEGGSWEIPLEILPITLFILTLHKMRTNKKRKSAGFWIFYWSFLVLVTALILILGTYLFLLFNLPPGSNI